MERKKLGEILVQQKILTPVLVERIIKISTATRRRFGQTLEDLGLLTGEEIAQALAIQFGYKIVTDIARHTIPQEVLKLISVETAFENRLFPLQVKNGNLAMAMADPTSTDIIATLSSNLRLTITPVIATTKDIMRAIAKNYLGEALESRTNSILVVEPDYGDRGILAAPLAAEGYNVLESVDATEGFQMALLNTPRLVITSKEMPGGDGFSFFTALQSVPETRRIPVILVSRRTSVEEEALAFQRGFFDYIPMPVRDITLLTRVRRALAAGKAYIPHGTDTAEPNVA
ncbi:MAG TPA: response regulator [Geobacteraceae bacterium]